MKSKGSSWWRDLVTVDLSFYTSPLSEEIRDEAVPRAGQMTSCWSFSSAASTFPKQPVNASPPATTLN